VGHFAGGDQRSTVGSEDAALARPVEGLRALAGRLARQWSR